MSEPPVWLLDVDGVINVRRPGWGGPPHTGRANAMGVVWPMRWAPALVRRIGWMHRTGLVEVRWCTTWCAYPGEVDRVFRLPGIARAFGDVPDPTAAKLASVARVVEGGRRLVWTDDDVVPEPGPLYDALTAGGRALLIRPDPRRGLNREHLRAIERFARGTGAES